MFQAKSLIILAAIYILIIMQLLNTTCIIIKTIKLYDACIQD